jgi:multidrug efflux system outer membrane protein
MQGSVRVVAAQLPSALLTQRPDILAAEHRLKAAHADIGAARAAFFPQVMLTGSIGTASPQLDGLFDAGTRTWAFLPTITVPIFNAGRLRSNLELARVRRDIAVSSYESTIQGAFRDVADALSAEQSLTEQVEIQRRALTALTERARLAQLRYDSGAATYLEVLDAQRDLLVTQQTLVQTQRAVQSTRVSLFAALGGGSLGDSGS